MTRKLIILICHRFVDINKYWDRISKCLICLVDAGLNWYFLRVVKQRLVEQYGLMKYAPLVDFNTRLMVLSVLLDVRLESFWLRYGLDITNMDLLSMQILLIGLMSLPNQESFILFHPVVYMSKLNIEISMAGLIVKLARSGRADAYNYHPHSNPHSNPHTNSTPGGRNNNRHRGSAMPIDVEGSGSAHAYPNKEREVALKTFTESKIRASFSNNSPDGEDGPEIHHHHHHHQGAPEGGIQRTREFRVTVHHSSAGSMDGDSKDDGTIDVGEDEAGLTSHPGHPKSNHHVASPKNPFEAPQRVMHARR